MIRSKMFDNMAFDVIYDGISYFIVLIILPLAILGFCTYRLVKTLKARKNQTFSGFQQSKEDVTLSLVIVVIIYTLCQLPNPFRHVWTYFDDDIRCGSTYYVFAALHSLQFM